MCHSAPGRASEPTPPQGGAQADPPPARRPLGRALLRGRRQAQARMEQPPAIARVVDAGETRRGPPPCSPWSTSRASPLDQWIRDDQAGRRTPPARADRPSPTAVTSRHHAVIGIATSMPQLLVGWSTAPQPLLIEILGIATGSTASRQDAHERVRSAAPT
jgi:hypothetical protein